MNFSFFRAGNQHQHYLYTVIIGTGVVSAVLWHPEGESIVVDQVSPPQTWDSENQDSLIEVVDSVVGNFPENIEVSEMMLSLPEDWVSGQTISSSHKSILKAITQKLELSSVGFVVTLEAVIAGLRDKASQPVSMICVLVEQDAFILSVVRQNNASHLVRVGRSGQTAEDFLEGISRLKLSELPPRILLTSLGADEEELSVLSSDLSAHEWDANIFTQMPTVDIMNLEDFCCAVAQSGGKEVSKALGLLEAQPVKAQEAPAAHFEPIAPAHGEQPQGNAEVLENNSELVHKSPFPSFSFSKKRAIKILAALAVITAIGIAVFVFFIPKLVQARVEIQRKEFPIDGQVVLTVSAEEPQEDEIAGELISVTVEGEKQVPTTGKKTVGEKAKGSVTIFNKTAQSRQFKAGTLLKTGKLTFVTDEDVTVASASSTISETVNGKATVKISAQAIGEDSNIDKNIEMTVATFDKSAFVGRTESPIAGGTSKSVAMVTQKDQDSAVSELVKDLEKKAQEELGKKANVVQETALLEIPTQGAKKFSKAVGEEGESVSVQMNATSSGLLYTKAQATSVIEKKLAEQVPSGVKLLPEKTALTLVSQKKVDDKKVELTLTVKSTGKVSVDKGQYAKLLAGKNLEDSRSFLESQEALSSYEMKLSPSFITFLSKMPTDPAKITITIDE